MILKSTDMENQKKRKETEVKRSADNQKMRRTSQSETHIPIHRLSVENHKLALVVHSSQCKRMHFGACPPQIKLRIIIDLTTEPDFPKAVHALFGAKCMGRRPRRSRKPVKAIPPKTEMKANTQVVHRLRGG